MVRNRRIRTREEIEEDLHQNERDNAAPDGLEDRAFKRRRQSRLSRNKCRLNKELATLIALDGVENSAPSESNPPEQASQSGAERVQRHRERLTPEEQATVQHENTQRRRELRASQTPEQQAAEVHLNSQRRQDVRGVMTPDEQALKRERNTHGRHELRASQTVEQQTLDRENNMHGRHELRAAVKPEEEALARQRNTCSRRELRNALALKEQEREHRRQERERVAQGEETREAQREAVRIRRKCMRRGHALYNHERFAIARVSGKNVRDGRHTLPEMYECIWCGAWKWPGESDVSCCLKGRVQLPPLTPAPSYLLGYYRDEAFRRNIRAYNQVFAFASVGVARSDDVGVQGVREDIDVQGQQGVFLFRVQGAMGHYLGSLLPRLESNGVYFQPAKFAQIYIVDEDDKQRAERRKSSFADLGREKLTTLEMIMQTYNLFAQQFLSYAEKIRQGREAGRPVMDLKFQRHAGKRRPGTTNLPTTNEVGTVMIEDGISKYRGLIPILNGTACFRFSRQIQCMIPSSTPPIPRGRPRVDVHRQIR
ncbi:hypothetical protein PI124_g7671 [Phytophthora idaei]|nr:hypothetical protein PI125_g16417 [Phytophthora idaei]KAG3160373.1 hypothetical protein PI126_g6933 [Phytophthora idaei]KAG3247612.1 hypothetical protein PI124_g7671 [Phytophthora idaei]